jgi:hypothetical protein
MLDLEIVLLPLTEHPNDALSTIRRHLKNMTDH